MTYLTICRVFDNRLFGLGIQAQNISRAACYTCPAADAAPYGFYCHTVSQLVLISGSLSENALFAKRFIISKK